MSSHWTSIEINFTHAQYKCTAGHDRIGGLLMSTIVRCININFIGGWTRTYVIRILVYRGLSTRTDLQELSVVWSIKIMIMVLICPFHALRVEIRRSQMHEEDFNLSPGHNPLLYLWQKGGSMAKSDPGIYYFELHNIMASIPASPSLLAHCKI